MRVRFAEHALTSQRRFPFLFGGTFIEGCTRMGRRGSGRNFPSFSEGLSLRGQEEDNLSMRGRRNFPSFSEGLSLRVLGGG